MYQRILVPLDGSPRAERAVPTAARLARASGGTVMLVQVMHVLPAYAPYLDPSAVGWAGLETDEREANAYLRQIADSPALAGVTAETIVLSGPIGPTLVRAARTQHADLIVLSSHGRTGVSRWVMGSVAEHVARHAPVPILVLRDTHPPTRGPQLGTERPLRVLVPLDGSPLAEEALVPAAQLAAGLAAPAQGALHLVHVINEANTGGTWESLGRLEPVIPFGGLPPMYPLPPVEAPDLAAREAALKESKGYMSSLAARLRRDGMGGVTLAVTWSVVFGGDVADAIIDAAVAGEETPGATLGTSDVIAMATHGRGGLDRWVMGSVTERVLHGTAFPVLIVHSQAVAQELATIGERADAGPLP